MGESQFSKVCRWHVSKELLFQFQTLLPSTEVVEQTVAFVDHGLPTRQWGGLVTSQSNIACADCPEEYAIGCKVPELAFPVRDRQRRRTTGSRLVVHAVASEIEQ
eukprot:6458369-Amphidinium_carterae.2